MKKRIFGRKFSRDHDSRRALYRSLARSFLLNQSVVTTKTKAKAAQGFVERLLTVAKRNTVNDNRKVYAILGNDRKTSNVLFELVKKIGDRNGGYTRIVPLPARRGDNTPMARLELVERVEIDQATRSNNKLTRTKDDKAKPKKVKAKPIKKEDKKKKS